MKKVVTPIKVVRAWRVKIPLKEPYYLSKIYPTITHSDCFVVELEADDLSGWGEAMAVPAARNTSRERSKIYRA